MSALDAALAYAVVGWPVFPCYWRGERRKRPMTEHGFEDASTDPVQIEAWWIREPSALISVPTGLPSTFVVLDIDVKPARPAAGNRPARPAIWGFDALNALGFSILPCTRMVHTVGDPELGPGLHLHFDGAGQMIRGTVGLKGRGIGRGLDWRASGNYAIVPSPGSGYEWDPVCGLDIPLAPVPPELLPRDLARQAAHKPVGPVDGLSPYARAALDSACRKIINAPNGEQEATLNGEAFAIGTLAGASAIPEGFALRALIWAASQIRDYDPRRPWRAGEIEGKVQRSFADGLSHRREVRRYG